MRLLYLVSQRLPTEKAYGRQIAKMCSKFADFPNVDLELIYPTRHNLIKESFFEYYGIKDNFRISIITALDFYVPSFLEVLAFSIKNIISAIVLTKTALSRDLDIIYSRDELPLYILSFFRKNLVFEAHNLQRPRTFMYNRFMKRGIKIIAITKSLKDDFVKTGFSPEKILVASDGVDAEVLEKEEKSPADMKSARVILELPVDKKIVVYTGSLFRWKGVFTLADSAKLLPDIMFIIVGGDERGDEAELGGHLAENHIENVKITGHIKSEETIRNHLASADVLVLPNTAKDIISAKYTSPLKLFSYMAARRPIVASNLASLREILNDSNSILVKPDDALALAEGIKMALTDSVLSLRIAQVAFEDVKKYSWQERVKKIINFIK